MTALCAVTLLTGCSGDDDGDDDVKTDASGSPSASTYEAPCTATVEITGDVEASWEGGADLTEGGGGVTYSTANDDANVLVNSAVKKQQPAGLTVAIAGDIFQAKPGAKGIDADPKGSGAEVDTKVTGKIKKKPATLNVVATFEC